MDSVFEIKKKINHGGKIVRFITGIATNSSWKCTARKESTIHPNQPIVCQDSTATSLQEEVDGVVANGHFTLHSVSLLLEHYYLEQRT